MEFTIVICSKHKICTCPTKECEHKVPHETDFGNESVRGIYCKNMHCKIVEKKVECLPLPKEGSEGGSKGNTKK